MKFISMKTEKTSGEPLNTESVFCEEMESENTFHFEYERKNGNQFSMTAKVTHTGLTVTAYVDEGTPTQETYTVNLTKAEEKKLAVHLNGFFENMEYFASMPYENPFLTINQNLTGDK